MNEYIHKYIKQGIKVFACLPTKNPATKNGFYAATTDIEELKNQFHSDNFLIGMPTGNINGIVIIDIDNYKDGRSIDELLDALKEFGEIPETFQVETLSGGRHLYFSISETKISTNSWFFDKSLPIDIRGNGGYACVPDGKNYIIYDDVDDLDITNLKSRCAPLPQWIEDYKRQISKSSETTIVRKLPESEILELRSALSYLSSDDRDLWVSIGFALKETGDPAAYGLWNEWSQTSQKYNPHDMEYRWRTLKPTGNMTIASIFYEAKKNGWVTTYPVQKNITAEILPSGAVKLKKIIEKEPFPINLLNPGGLVGDIAEYITQNAIKPQPIFSLAAALSAVGALAGRKYQTSFRNRTNIYCVCVGRSGCGKEAPRGAIKTLFEAAGCPEYACVDTIASDTAIMTALAKHPSQLFLLDEIGRFLKTTLSASKNSYLYNIVTTIMTLFGQASQTVYGKIYADDDKKIKVVQPNLCIYGTTVPDTLYRGLSIEHVTDGFLSRMLIFETDDPRPPKRRRTDLTQPPPVEIIDQIKALKNVKINHNPEGDIDDLNPNPKLVDITPSAVDILEEFDDYIENLREELERQHKVELVYNRTSQVAEQLALIIAIGKNIDNPVINDESIIYGISLAKFLADRMLYIAENYIASNDYEHELKRIYQIILEAGGSIQKSALTRKTQNLNANIRNDILFNLSQSKQIMESTDPETKSQWITAIEPEYIEGIE